jgi:hypothetical protein
MIKTISAHTYVKSAGANQTHKSINTKHDDEALTLYLVTLAWLELLIDGRTINCILLKIVTHIFVPYEDLVVSLAVLHYLLKTDII